jgi:hypothetical protein
VIFPVQKIQAVNQPTNQPTTLKNKLVRSSGDYLTSTDSVRIDYGSFDQLGFGDDCSTCIDLPGDGNPTICTPSDEYTLGATLNNITATTITSNVPTWRLSPFWGGIIGEVETALENFEQNEVSELESSPYHQFFELDYRLTAETTVMPSGELNLSLKLFDLFGKLYFQRTTIYTSNAKVTVSADAFEVEGVYNIAQDSFIITGSEFENLDADIDIGGLFALLDDIKCFLFGSCTIQSAEGDVEETIRDLIADEVDQVNRNSPNMFLRSLINHPETDNILPLLDQAIMELLQDDVSAILNVALPSCGDIDRDGLIDLEVSTN